MAQRLTRLLRSAGAGKQVQELLSQPLELLTQLPNQLPSQLPVPPAVSSFGDQVSKNLSSANPQDLLSGGVSDLGEQVITKLNPQERFYSALLNRESLTVQSIELTNELFHSMGLRLKIMTPGIPDARSTIKVVGLEDEGSSNKFRSGLTPRQCIQMMREALQADIGATKNVEHYISKLSPTFKQLPCLPESFQQKIYTDVARIIVFTFEQLLYSLDKTTFWGHSVKVETRSLKQMSGLTESVVGEEQIEQFVDNLLRAGATGPVSKAVMKPLYTNCMTIVFQLVEHMLTGPRTRISVMGHNIRFQLKPIDMQVLRQQMQNRTVKQCDIAEDVLSELVDELLADADINVLWMPDVIEKQVYMGVLRLMIEAIVQLLDDMKLSVLGREVSMSLNTDSVGTNIKAVSSSSVPGPEVEGQKALTEVERPLSAVSTSELHERRAFLEEQKRVLEGLMSLKNKGVVLFDLSEEAPKIARGAVVLPAAKQAQENELAEEGAEAEAKVHEFEILCQRVKLARHLHLTKDLDVDIDVPYSMISDMETYHLWMPWCTDGKNLDARTPETKEFKAEVGFGFETGTFLGTLGDTVRYKVTVEPPGPDGLAARVLADTVEGGFAYGERLVYDWRFSSKQGGGTEVKLDLLFQAKSVIYLPIWDSMKSMIMGGMMQAFVERSKKLQDQKKSESASS